ncbi:MAG: molecular chaperone DnaK [Aequorivita sp.]|nr:molecular chaperone DnaK [Aequorivita sp.]|tara:strand:- start:56923 stop:57618 length:696 start_codon:yes stop_codon:yes gene_type:complete
MKKSKLFAVIGGIGLAVLSIFLISADHIDAPAVQGTTADITDFYAFQGQNTSNFVFIANVQGLLSPGQPTDEAVFDETVLLEFNIDYNNDLNEDLVIQAIKRGDSMYFFGPTAPAFSGEEGTKSTIATSTRRSVKISTRDDVQIAEQDGMKFFAGPREDPFFFDFNQYNAVLSGTASSFNNPGMDTFAGTNVLSVVVEFPKSMLPGGTTGVNQFAPSTPMYNVWVEAKRKQ